MPEICYFYGIKIYINYREHDPPHFHAEYGEYKIKVNLGDWIIEGKFPKRALKMVLQWAKKHKEELLQDWELSKSREPLIRIEPLK